MGLKKTVGAVVGWWGKPFTVIGVVKNMVITSPYDDPRPIVFSLLGPNDAGNVAIVKINPASSRCWRWVSPAWDCLV
jgi:hypothetical protein